LRPRRSMAVTLAISFMVPRHDRRVHSPVPAGTSSLSAAPPLGDIVPRASSARTSTARASNAVSTASGGGSPDASAPGRAARHGNGRCPRREAGSRCNRRRLARPAALIGRLGRRFSLAAPMLALRKDVCIPLACGERSVGELNRLWPLSGLSPASGRAEFTHYSGFLSYGIASERVMAGLVPATSIATALRLQCCCTVP
jgi:hypothetical protein